MAELYLDVKVVPGATSNRIVGPLGTRLKIQVSAPPEKGKANQAVIDLVAESFGVSLRDVSVVAGQTNPKKRIHIRLGDAQQGEMIKRRLMHGSV